jgi:cytochrome b561
MNGRETPLTNRPNRYGIVPQFLHWVTVILVIVAWTLGTFGDELPKGEGRATGLLIHISAGLLIVVTLMVRLAWRVATSNANGMINPATEAVAIRGVPVRECTHFPISTLCAPVATIMTSP